jgi:transcriptional regulator with XRE-family HTH domain
MKIAEIFSETDYKEILKKQIIYKKKLRPHYTFEAVAKACGVQKTYLSRILRHKGNLSLDQIYLACDFLKFKSLEIEYTVAVYLQQICTAEKRKSFYRNRAEEIRKKALNTESKLSVKAQNPASQMLSQYYADPYYSLIHMFLTLEEYRQNPQALASVLSIDQSRVSSYLDDLESMGIIQQQGRRWKVVKNNIHLPESSPFVKAHRSLLRVKAMEKIDRLDPKDFYSFTVVFSADGVVKRQAHELFLTYLEEVQDLVNNSAETEVYQMNFDLLKWS